MTIIDEVDDATLTPSDFTLRVFNIPKEMQVGKVKELIRNICPEEIELSNVNIAKRFDSRIHVFKAFVSAAKVLKDIRSIKYRELKATYIEKSKEELMGIIMDDE